MGVLKKYTRFFTIKIIPEMGMEQGEIVQAMVVGVDPDFLILSVEGIQLVHPMIQNSGSDVSMYMVGMTINIKTGQ